MWIRNLISYVFSESIFISNINVDSMTYTYMLKLKIDRYRNSETFSSYLLSLKSISCMMTIFIVIDPVELQPFKQNFSVAIA
jgi:hypothetical protein